MSNFCQNLWAEHAKVAEAQTSCAEVLDLANKEGEKYLGSLIQSLASLEGELQKMQEVWDDCFITLPDERIIFGPELEALNELSELMGDYLLHPEDFIQKLTKISKEGHVTTVDFMQNEKMVDISPIARLTHLRFLDLRGTGITDLSPTRGLTGIHTIRLNGSKVSDISPLLDLRNMQMLELHSTDVADISALRNMHKLTHLTLYSTNISDASVLGELVSLQSLNMSGTNVTDISPLLKLNNLQAVNLGGNSEVRKLKPEIIEALRAKGVIVN